MGPLLLKAPSHLIGAVIYKRRTVLRIKTRQGRSPFDTYAAERRSPMFSNAFLPRPSAPLSSVAYAAFRREWRDNLQP